MANLAAHLRSGAAQSYSTLIEADAGPASLRAYTASFATLLATVPLNEPAFTESGGVLTLDITPVPSALIIASGTAAVWEIVDGNGTRCIDGDFVTDIVLDDVNFVAGQPFNIPVAITVTVPP